MKSVGIVYNNLIEGSKDIANDLGKNFQPQSLSFVHALNNLPETLDINALIVLGGDGTILSAAHKIYNTDISILGVNMGTLGFMTELNVKEAFTDLDNDFVENAYKEKRSMIEADIITSKQETLNNFPFLALNEIVVGSGSVAKMARIEVKIDDQWLTEYRSDSVIVSTATGSTGYSLSAGGPILYPTSSDILLQPVAAHLGFGSGLILPSNSSVELKVMSTDSASISADGIFTSKLIKDNKVLVKLSKNTVKFLRRRKSFNSYRNIMKFFGMNNSSN
jgi:NAD+ kinase